MTLRPYQQQAIDRMRHEVSHGARSICLVLPTGGGKTTIASAVIRGHLQRVPNARVLMVAHRQELVSQAAATLTAHGLPPEHLRVVSDGGAVGRADAPVTVATVDTLIQPQWLPTTDGTTLAVLDECHHTQARTWSVIAERHRGAIRVGLTATPERADGRPLGDIFERLVSVVTVGELIEQGYLVPTMVRAPLEYKDHMAECPLIAYQRIAPNSKAILFTINKAHAKLMAAKFTDAGYPAECVSDLADRRGAIARFKNGETKVLTNCLVLTEGFDEPSCETVIIARGATHAGIYMQMVGRGKRPHSGKSTGIVIDLRGAIHLHGHPDADRDFSLGGKAISIADRMPSFTQCPKCGACYKPSPRCPLCGRLTPPPRDPRVRRAELAEIALAETPDQRRRYLEYLQRTAAERGYHSNWITIRYRVKYGTNP